MQDHVRHIATKDCLPVAHIKMLERLAHEFGFMPKVIYDFGACVLHWTRHAEKIWPESRIYLFEAYELCQILYDGYEYHIGVVSSEDNKTVKFYQNPYNLGGNSVYREHIYAENQYVEMSTKTLDTIVKERSFLLPDLVKMDVQGSEMDIVLGGLQTLNNAKFLILELQRTEYNIGAPMRDYVIDELYKKGFVLLAGDFSNNGPDGDNLFINRNALDIIFLPTKTVASRQTTNANTTTTTNTDTNTSMPGGYGSAPSTGGYAAGVTPPGYGEGGLGGGGALPVSILTPTTTNRIDFLMFVAKGIVKQDYKNIKEWVIVDGTREGKSEVPSAIETIRAQHATGLPNIVFIEQDVTRNNNIGALRNILNEKATGDISVCFDDDDLYPVTRISHAVASLSTNVNGALIAGCTDVIFYDHDFHKLFQYNGFGANHSPGCAMAWRKEYVEKGHRFSETITHGEEASFTNGFNEPMIQLKPSLTIVNTSHSGNTFSKKINYWDNVLRHPNMKVLRELATTLEDYHQDTQYLQEYLTLLDRETLAFIDYDIVYYCGPMSFVWDPRDRSLGGSEQAVVQLSTQWAKAGHKVGVYGSIKEEGHYDGVDYLAFYRFNPYRNYHTVILWRTFGVFPLKEMHIKADRVLIDLHDRDNGGAEGLVVSALQRYANSNLMLKSNFHLEYYLSKLADQPVRDFVKQKTIILPNGLQKEVFAMASTKKRNKYRMCYASCYTRGLEQILEWFFPALLALVPQVELHVYYGMNMVNDENFKAKMNRLLAQRGVHDHGRQSLEVVAEEKRVSNFHIYLTETTCEIDCISIKESALVGCIPVLSNKNLFKDRPGFHIDGDLNETYYKRAAKRVADLIKDEKMTEKIREKIMKSDELYSWEDIALKWGSDPSPRTPSQGGTACSPEPPLKGAQPVP